MASTAHPSRRTSSRASAGNGAWSASASASASKAWGTTRLSQRRVSAAVAAADRHDDKRDEFQPPPGRPQQADQLRGVDQIPRAVWLF